MSLVRQSIIPTSLARLNPTKISISGLSFSSARNGAISQPLSQSGSSLSALNRFHSHLYPGSVHFLLHNPRWGALIEVLRISRLALLLSERCRILVQSCSFQCDWHAWTRPQSFQRLRVWAFFFNPWTHPAFEEPLSHFTFRLQHWKYHTDSILFKFDTKLFWTLDLRDILKPRKSLDEKNRCKSELFEV